MEVEEHLTLYQYWKAKLLYNMLRKGRKSKISYTSVRFRDTENFEDWVRIGILRKLSQSDDFHIKLISN